MPEFSTYQELIDYYHRFLKREVRSLHDELEEESDVIVPQLLAINRAGILSFSSQPGSQEVADDGEVFLQRAYLSCYMKLKLVQKLQAKCIGDDRIIVFIEGLAALQEEPLTTVPVSIEKIDEKSDDEYAGMESNVHTFVSLGFKYQDLDNMLYHTGAEKRAIIVKDLVQVHFIDLVWGDKTHLFDSVAKWAAECI